MKDAIRSAYRYRGDHPESRESSWCFFWGVSVLSVFVEGPRKVYPGHVTTLDGIHLRVDRGMFGPLGPNGAGKTTLMRILARIIEPTAGRVEVLDFSWREAREIRRRLGYLPQTFGF